MAEESKEARASIITTICFSLKDCDNQNFSDAFWVQLNKALRVYLREKQNAGQQPMNFNTTTQEKQLDPERISMIRLAIETNARLDDSLLQLTR